MEQKKGDLVTVRYSCMRKSLRLASARYALTPSAIHTLLLVEELSKASNAVWIERSAILIYLGVQDSLCWFSFNALLEGGYIQARGGEVRSLRDPSKRLRFNRAQYALTGKALPLIQFVKDTYAELLAQPLAQRYRGGVIKGSKRAGERGKVISKPDLPTL